MTLTLYLGENYLEPDATKLKNEGFKSKDVVIKREGRQIDQLNQNILENITFLVKKSLSAARLTPYCEYLETTFCAAAYRET